MGQDFERIVKEENVLRKKYVGPVAVVGRVGLKNGEHPNGTLLSALTLTIDADLIFFSTEVYSIARAGGDSESVAAANAWIRVQKGQEIALTVPNQTKNAELSLVGKRIMAIGYPALGMTAWYVLPHVLGAQTVELLPSR